MLATAQCHSTCAYRLTASQWAAQRPTPVTSWTGTLVPHTCEYGDYHPIQSSEVLVCGGCVSYAAQATASVHPGVLLALHTRHKQHHTS